MAVIQKYVDKYRGTQTGRTDWRSAYKAMSEKKASRQAKEQEEQKKKKELTLKALQLVSFGGKNVSKAPEMPAYDPYKKITGPSPKPENVTYEKLGYKDIPRVMVKTVAEMGRSDNLAQNILASPISGLAMIGDSAIESVYALKAAQSARNVQKRWTEEAKKLKSQLDAGKITQEQYAKGLTLLGSIYNKASQQEINKATAFTGNRTNKQLVGETALASVDALTAGALSKAKAGLGALAKTNVKQIPKLISKEGAKQVAKSGAKYGSLGSVGAGSYSLATGGDTEDAKNAAIVGGLFGTGLGIGGRSLSVGGARLFKKAMDKRVTKATAELKQFKQKYSQLKSKNTREANAIKKEIQRLTEEKKLFEVRAKELEAKYKLGKETVEVKDKEAVKYNKQLAANKGEGVTPFSVPKPGTAVEPPVGKTPLDTSYRSAHQITDGVGIKDVDATKLKEQVRVLDGYISNDKLRDFSKLQKMQQLDPNAEVTIYRASPVNEINAGDWVTTNRTYANNIKQQNGGKVYAHTVKVSDLNLPKDISNNPSGARFSAFQYNPAQPTGVGKTPLALPGKIAKPLSETKVIEKPINAKKVWNEIVKSKGKTESAAKKIDKLANDMSKLERDKQNIVLSQIAEERGGKRSVVSKTLAKSRVGRLFQAVENNVAAENPKMANKLKIQAHMEGQLLSEGETMLQKLTKLSKENPKQYKKVIQDITTKERGQLSGLSKEVAGLLDARKTALEKLGVKIGTIKKYFPRLLDPSKRTEAIKYLENNGHRKEASLLKEVYSRGLRPQKADLEYHRAIKALPEEFYIQDPAIVLSNWNKETAGRLAEGNVWGTGLEYMQKDMEELSGDMAKYFQNAYDVARFGIKNESPYWKTARGIQVITKMPLSVLSNASQSVNTAVVGGATNTARATKAFFRDSAKLEQKALKHGINVHYITDTLSENIYTKVSESLATKGAEGMLKVTGFKAVERFNRLVATEVGESYVKRLAKNPLSKVNAGRLRDLGLNPETIAKKGLSSDDLSLGVREFVGKTQFFTATKDLPAWTSTSSVGKTAAQLSQFGMKQGQMIKDQIIIEAMRTAKDGDVRHLGPLLKYLLLGTAAGEVVSLVRNKITGSEPEYTIAEVIDALEKGEIGPAVSRAKNSLERAGGFGYVASAIESTKFGKTGPEKAIRAIGGPTFNDLWDILSAAGNVFSEENRQYGIDQFVKKGVKAVPFADPIMTNLKKYAGTDYSGVPVAGETLDRVSVPYSPRSNEFYEAAKTAKIGKLPSAEESADLVSKVKSGQSLSGTNFAKNLVGKLYNDKGQETLLVEKQKQAILNILNKYGISDAKAEWKIGQKSDKARANELERARNVLSKEETRIRQNFETSEKAKTYLKSVGKSLNDYPKLKSYYELREQ